MRELGVQSLRGAVRTIETDFAPRPNFAMSILEQAYAVLCDRANFVTENQREENATTFVDGLARAWKHRLGRNVRDARHC